MFIELVVPDCVYKGSIDEIDFNPETSELADCKIESGTGVYL